jgi:hypothetical protein
LKRTTSTEYFCSSMRMASDSALSAAFVDVYTDNVGIGHSVQ